MKEKDLEHQTPLPLIHCMQPEPAVKVAVFNAAAVSTLAFFATAAVHCHVVAL
jgi:hypothetical protein